MIILYDIKSDMSADNAFKEKPMRKLYFVRHGETVWNKENKICGATDSPLTEQGIRQAEQTGGIILERRIAADEMICSPLSRAQDTAKIISEITGIPMRTDPRLREQDFGRYEGTARDGQEFHSLRKNLALRLGGESSLQLAQRIYNLLDELTAEHDKSFILVAHNGIARCVHSYFYEMTNDEYASFGLKNCEIREYGF